MNLPRWRTSLFAKITWLAIACSLAMFAIIAVFVGRFSDDLHHHHHAAHNRTIKIAARRIHAQPTVAQIERIAEQYDIDIRYQSPLLQYASDDDLPSFDAVHPIRRLRGGSLLARGAGGQLVLIHRRGDARVMMMQEQETPDLWAEAGGSIVLLVIALGLLWLGFYFYQRHLLAPLTQLRQTMEAVGQGEWQQATISGKDEIGELASGFNQMQAQLRAAADTKTRFLADASHELRSPLARLRLAAEFITDAALQRRMVADINELEQLTGDIMEKTRLDNFTQTLQKEPLRASALLDALRDKYPSVRFSATGTARIDADAPALTRALSNLLDNAVKFCRTDARAECEDSAGGVSFRIRNDGESPAETDLPHLFEPFYRADISRSRQTGGFGLGLSIVKAVIDAHSGTIRAARIDGGGLEITVWLPVAVETAATEPAEPGNAADQ